MTRKRTFEDFAPGAEFAIGPYKVEAEEMVAFAREFDPQPFHLDEEAGRRSLLGGLAASGWYTLAVLMRMAFDAFVHDTHSMGSPGVEAVKWVRPVLAGDTLSGTVRVIETRASKSRPDMGIALLLFTVTNQRGEVVMTQRNPVLIARGTSP